MRPLLLLALRIYAIDVEGGKATLYISPSGESMLIDTGYAGYRNRDALRIAAAAKAAGIRRIDHLVITHYHGDHVGGVAQLAEQLPIGVIYDHGDDTAEPAIFRAYANVRAKYKHVALKAGDTIPVKGLRVDVVSASGRAISRGGDPNPLCASYRPLPADRGENAKSLGLTIAFGNFRVADLGDLFWNQEYDLACPRNQLGQVDLYMVTHHATKTSGCPQIVHALRAKVAVMNNGADKGGSIEAWETIRHAPGLIDLWQLHYSNVGGKGHNVEDRLIANPTEPCQGKWIEIEAHADRTFTVRNGRTGYAKNY